MIVEFSVNDEDNNFYLASYENLVRRIMEQDNDPAVMLLYMVRKNGSSAQKTHEQVGKWYQLPQISYGDAVLYQIENGDITWNDISNDNIHPNDRGHQICGELIWKYLNSIYTEMNPNAEYSNSTELSAKKMMTSDFYLNGTILNNQILKADYMRQFVNQSVTWSFFGDGWSTDNGGEIEFRIRAKSLGIFYYKSIEEAYGEAQVYIDSELVATLDADFTDGYDNKGYAEQVFLADVCEEHLMKIVVPEGYAFDVIGLLVSK